jgi:hypothetical protein
MTAAFHHETASHAGCGIAEVRKHTMPSLDLDLEMSFAKAVAAPACTTNLNSEGK